jgi:hypothetical protein
MSDVIRDREFLLGYVESSPGLSLGTGMGVVINTPAAFGQPAGSL